MPCAAKEKHNQRRLERVETAVSVRRRAVHFSKMNLSISWLLQLHVVSATLEAQSNAKLVNLWHLSDVLYRGETCLTWSTTEMFWSEQPKADDRSREKE